MPDQEFLSLIRMHLKYLQPSDELDVDKPLKSLGLDSMASVNLLLDIEDFCGVTMPDRYLTEETFSTTRALWSVVQALKEEAEPCPA